MISITDLKKDLEAILKSEAEANLILFSLLKDQYEIKKFSDLYNKNLALNEPLINCAMELAKKRKSGIPLQHLIHSQFFLNHEYLVNKHVLIPRPETEILLTKIFERIMYQPKYFAELGLGSGIISCELLHHYPNLKGVASELSEDAREVAERNLSAVVGAAWPTRLKIVTPKSKEFGFETLLPFAPFDLIASNPPYVSSTDEIEEQVMKHEPEMALFPPKHPNYFYQNFLVHYKALLSPGSAAFFELPHERAQEIKNLFLAAALKVELIDDLTGRPRVLIAHRIN